MAVFDGSVKTTRRIADPITDKQVSSVASLALPAISTPAALLYPGSDVSVVHGIQHLQVDNDRIMRVNMNQDVTIGMNEMYLVDMSRSMTVMQNYSRNVMMNSTIGVTGNYAKTILSNYSKNITGNSVNTITGSYSKAVTANYSKSVTGNADNQITGNYSKSVQSTYTKAVTGTATTTVTGDYTKNLLANYSKSVTGASAVKVTGTSNENYTGDHSRMYANNHKTYIVGDDNHTTLGSTLDSRVGPKMFGQSGAHQQQHEDASQEDRSILFKTAYTEGVFLAERLELLINNQTFIGNQIEVALQALEGTGLGLELIGGKQAFGIASNETMAIKGEEHGDKDHAAAIDISVHAQTFTFQITRSDIAPLHEELGLLALRGEPVNLFYGVLFGGNQFCM